MFDQEVAHVFLHLVGEAGTVTVEKVQMSEQRAPGESIFHCCERMLFFNTRVEGRHGYTSVPNQKAKHITKPI